MHSKILISDSDHKFIDHVVDLLQTMPEEHAVCCHQESLIILRNHCRLTCEKKFREDIREWDSLPVAAAHFILDECWDGAFVTGASIYACLTRKFEEKPRTDVQVDLENAWQGALDRRNPQKEEYAIFDNTLRQFGRNLALCHVLAENILGSMENLTLVKDHRDLFYYVIMNNIFYGMALEASYAEGITAKQELEAAMASLFESATGEALDPGMGNFEDIMKQHVRKAMTNCDHIHPWPRDQMCLCGHSLKPFIFCCNPENPIDMSTYADTLTEEFELRRDCCNMSESGFRCDICGRVYTWQKGIVDSLK